MSILCIYFFTIFVLLGNCKYGRPTYEEEDRTKPIPTGIHGCKGEVRCNKITTFCSLLYFRFELALARVKQEDKDVSDLLKEREKTYDKVTVSSIVLTSDRMSDQTKCKTVETVFWGSC